jgi:hypothetical protein
MFGAKMMTNTKEKFFISLRKSKKLEKPNQKKISGHSGKTDKLVGKDWRDETRPIHAPFIVWEEGYVDITATEALSAVNENKAPGMLEDAKEFLNNILVEGGGRAPKTDIEEAAEAE